MPSPNVLVLRSPGSNCDGELKFAFELAGAKAELVHINRLRENPKLLKQYQVLGVPGGFTYGDDVAAGKILANQLARRIVVHGVAQYSRWGCALGPVAWGEGAVNCPALSHD